MGSAPKAIGVDMVHVARLISDVRGSRAPSYGPVLEVPETTKIGVKIQADITKFSADNRVTERIPKLASAQVSVGMGGLSMAGYNAYMGWPAPESNVAARLDDLSKNPNPVAFGYRRKFQGLTADGRQRFRYLWLFNVMFLPPDDETDTEPEKGVTVQPDTLVGEAIALESYLPGQNYWRYVYDNWADGASAAQDESFFDVVTGVVNVPTITITGQPQSTVETAGAIDGALTVAAAASSGILTYQWYKASANLSGDGVAVAGATGAVLTIPTDLTAGLHYFYCLLGVSGNPDVKLASDAAVVVVE